MAGLGPAIHVCVAPITERRGWPAFAGHDGVGQIVLAESHSLRHLVLHPALAVL
jgi:hypothetical protein